MNALEARIKSDASLIASEIADLCSRSTSRNVTQRLMKQQSGDSATTWRDGWNDGWGNYGKTMIESDTITASIIP